MFAIVPKDLHAAPDDECGNNTIHCVYVRAGDPRIYLNHCYSNKCTRIYAGCVRTTVFGRRQAVCVPGIDFRKLLSSPRHLVFHYLPPYPCLRKRRDGEGRTRVKNKRPRFSKRNSHLARFSLFRAVDLERVYPFISPFSCVARPA